MQVRSLPAAWLGPFAHASIPCVVTLSLHAHNSCSQFMLTTCRCERSQLFGWVEGGKGLHGAQAQFIRSVDCCHFEVWQRCPDMAEPLKLALPPWMLLPLHPVVAML